MGDAFLIKSSHQPFGRDLADSEHSRRGQDCRVRRPRRLRRDDLRARRWSEGTPTEVTPDQAILSAPRRVHHWMTEATSNTKALATPGVIGPDFLP